MTSYLLTKKTLQNNGVVCSSSFLSKSHNILIFYAQPQPTRSQRLKVRYFLNGPCLLVRSYNFGLISLKLVRVLPVLLLYPKNLVC